MIQRLRSFLPLLMLLAMCSIAFAASESVQNENAVTISVATDSLECVQCVSGESLLVLVTFNPALASTPTITDAQLESLMHISCIRANGYCTNLPVRRLLFEWSSALEPT